jgi:effector-binding domain-containing protein
MISTRISKSCRLINRKRTMHTKAKGGLSEPEIVDISPRTAAVEWGRMRFADIPQFHRGAHTRIEAALSQQGVQARGPWVTFSRPPIGDLIEIALGVIIESSFTPVGAVTIQEIPSGRAVRARLTGPYDQLPSAWPDLMAWVAAKGLTPAGLHWEVYADPAVPVTDLYTLLK